MKLYSMKEAAQELGISRAYMYYLKDMGRVKAEKIGAQWVITEAEIKRYREAK